MQEAEFFDYAQIEEINGDLLKKPALVSVWCPTYNHDKYIKDAFEGFLMQETDFAFQVVVYDDGSDDGTADIIREYAYRFPEIFHVFLAKRNTYQHPDRNMFIRALLEKNFVGKYLAICEGDDCWIDSRKLQIQVDYMEDYPNCSLYMHNAVRICYLDDMKIMAQNTYQCMGEKDLNGEEIIMLYRQHPATASMLLRKEFYFVPSEQFSAFWCDYSIQLNCMINGDVHYTDRIMSVYRFYREGSITSQLSKDDFFYLKFHLRQVIFLEQFDEYTSLKYHLWIMDRIQALSSGLIGHYDDGINSHILYHGLMEDTVISENREIINRLTILDRQIKDRQFVRDELIQFVKGFHNIVVMGIGQYANKLSEQLDNQNIKYCGYAVSKLNEDHEFRGKKVWQLDQLNREFDEVGVVIAINPLRWDELIDSLENAGIENYYCPYLL